MKRFALAAMFSITSASINAQDYVTPYVVADAESKAIEKGITRALLNVQGEMQRQAVVAQQNAIAAAQTAEMQRQAAIRKAEQQKAIAEYQAKNSAVRKQRTEARREIIKKRSEKAKQAAQPK